MANQRRVLDVAIIGGGMSGIAAAVRLQERLGRNVNFTIYERGSEPGGVWRDSRWPGVEVDHPIHLYQLYFELNPAWSSKYPARAELLSYFNSVIDRHGFRDRFVFNADFIESHWDELAQLHTLTFIVGPNSSPLHVKADIVISAAGALNTPIFPSLPGRDSFLGQQWHSSQWQEVDLRGKRVAVVGNGSSGIQIVPNIAKIPGVQVTQFIRSPGYFTPKINAPFSKQEKLAFTWIPGFQRLHRWRLFYEADVKSLARGLSPWSGQMRAQQSSHLLSYLRKNAPEKYLDALVPKYPLHCKRVAFDAGWLAALHKPNVKLVNSAITEITSGGLITADGAQHDFDMIVWATGFDVARTGVGLNKGVHGQDGQELAALWESQRGASAYLTVAVPKFPNWFTVLGPNAISLSSGYAIGNTADFISRIIADMHRLNLSSIAPKADVTAAYNEAVQARLRQTVLVSPACTAYYRYKGDGKVVAPSGVTGTELTIRTSEIKWEDWEVRRMTTYGKAEVVDLRTPRSFNPITLIYRALASRLELYLLNLTTEAEANVV